MFHLLGVSIPGQDCSPQQFPFLKSLHELHFSEVKTRLPLAITLSLQIFQQAWWLQESLHK